jgi:hypothetical protein
MEIYNFMRGLQELATNKATSTQFECNQTDSAEECVSKMMFRDILVYIDNP